MMMEIEFDPAKNAANREKHGLDFGDVYALDWDRALYKPDDRKDYGEPRMQSFVRDKKGKAYVVVFTVRGGALRIISFRKARERERKRFDVC